MFSLSKAHMSLEPHCIGASVEPEDDDESCCAICFEPQQQFVSLPCACRVNYCAGCWDRALATSVTVRGRAQCPSCRAVFRVDFDADAGSLVFAPDADSTAGNDWRLKLYNKAKPVQIRLLQSFGANLASGPPTRSTSTEDATAIPCACSTVDGALRPWLPSCVCGSALEHVSSRKRIIRMLEDTEPGWRSRVADPDSLVDRLMASSLVTCDLCNEVATKTGAVWTCQTGPHTVMHPAAYDVCERCFKMYAGTDGPAATAEAGETVPQPAPAPAQGSTRRSPFGCCHACASAMLSVLPRRWRRREALSAEHTSGAWQAPRPLRALFPGRQLWSL